MSPAKGLTLLEWVIAFTLSLFVLTAFGVLMTEILQQAQQQQHLRLLQQYLWQCQRILTEAIEHAGFSAVYPSNPSRWQALTGSPALRLYQVGTDTLPPALHHWQHKLLAGSTVLESQSLGQAQFVQSSDPYRITVAPIDHLNPHTPWLLVSPTTWQLLSVRAVHEGPPMVVVFNQAIQATLQPPYLAGLYQHKLWFVAENGQVNRQGSKQYGLYGWTLTDGSSPQEIVSGIRQWQGAIVRTRLEHLTSHDRSLLLCDWTIGLQQEQQSTDQHLYLANQNAIIMSFAARTS